MKAQNSRLSHAGDATLAARQELLLGGAASIGFTDAKVRRFWRAEVDVVGSVAVQKRELRELFDAAVARAQLAFA